jgi:hypothetical protein
MNRPLLISLVVAATLIGATHAARTQEALPLTTADRWFFIAKDAIEKGDFDTGLINLRRARDSAKAAGNDCVQTASEQALVAAQSAKEARKNGTSTEEAITLYGKLVSGGAECW